MIDIGYIQMHIAQILPVIDEAKAKEYDTPRIKEHIDTLEDIMDVLQTFDLNAKTPGELDEIRIILDYVSDCLGYIIHSTANDVPLEIYKALRHIIEEWVPDADKFIFVASEGRYCITKHYWSDIVNSIIKNVTSIDVKYKLIFFSVPTHLKNDYLCNTALYHELGHFVDWEYKISYILKIILLQNKVTLPDTEYLNNEKDINKIIAYVSEYFADLFAAQYLGPEAYSYLNYCAKYDGFSTAHPSTAKRVEVVNDFVSGNMNIIITIILSLAKSLKLPFKYRPQTIDVSCFIKGQPYPMTDTSDFHGILSSSVNLWTNDRDKFTNADGSQMHYLDAYSKMNSLIEQSVQDYRSKNP